MSAIYHIQEIPQQSCFKNISEGAQNNPLVISIYIKLILYELFHFCKVLFSSILYITHTHIFIYRHI